MSVSTVNNKSFFFSLFRIYISRTVGSGSGDFDCPKSYQKGCSEDGCPMPMET